MVLGFQGLGPRAHCEFPFRFVVGWGLRGWHIQRVGMCKVI